MSAGSYTLTPDTGQVTGAHTGFVALVRPSVLEIGALTLTEARSIRVYADANKTTQLPREVVSADEIRVKMPDGFSSSTQIWLDWDGVSGDHPLDGAFGAEAVWSSVYEGVWHLHQDPSGAVLDSTSNNRDLTSGGGMTSGNIATGPFGANALNFDGVDDFLYSSDQGLNITGDLTLEFWLYADTWAALDGIINFQGINDNSEDDNTIYSLRGYTTGGNGIFHWHEYGSGNNQSTIFDTQLSTTTWYHLHYVRDATAKSWTLYNGTSIVSVTVGQSTTYSTAPSGGTAGLFHLAKELAGSPSFLDGRLASVSVRSATVDADWVATAHRNQSDNAAFWVASPSASTVEESLTLGTVSAASPVAAATVGVTVTAAGEQTMGLLGGQAIAEAMTLAATSGVSFEMSLAYDSAVGLALSTGLTLQEAVTANPQVAAAVQATLAAVGQAAAVAGLSFDGSAGVTVAGAAVGLGFTTPDGRAVTVTVRFDRSATVKD